MYKLSFHNGNKSPKSIKAWHSRTQYRSIYLSIYLSVYLSICLSIYLSIYLYIYIYPVNEPSSRAQEGSLVRGFRV